MDLENARQLLATISPDARVVDIGGGASPFPRADYVLDARSFDERPVHREMALSYPRRFKKETWIQIDLCDHHPWPFEDKFFDFAICSHLLEDVRDPIWICSEMCRVAKGGYIEVPSRVLEQSLGVESPSYAGYYHHRWLVQRVGNGLEFRVKPHLLHSIPEAIVTVLPRTRMINPEHAITTIYWKDEFPFEEILTFDESEVIEELKKLASQGREISDLTVKSNRPLQSFYSRVKRRLVRS